MSVTTARGRRGVCANQPPVLNEQAARGRSRMEFRPRLIKDMEPKELILRAEGAPLINPPHHRTLPGKPGCSHLLTGHLPPWQCGSLQDLLWVL